MSGNANFIKVPRKKIQAEKGTTFIFGFQVKPSFRNHMSKIPYTKP